MKFYKITGPDGEPLHGGSDGHVLALGDPARLEDVLGALAGEAPGHDE